MNLSRGGASLSLGGRGAVVNISSRGTRATVGLPGTGISYTTRAGGGGRSESAARTQRALLRAQQYQEASAEVEQSEQDLEEELGAWRHALAIKPESSLRADLIERPFTFEEAPPASPDLPGQHHAHLTSVQRRVRDDHPLPPHQEYAWAAASALALLCFSAVHLTLGLLMAVVAAVATYWVVQSSWENRLRPIWEKRAAESWPAIKSELDATHAVATRAHVDRADAARVQWGDAERERVATLRRVLAGDLESIADTIVNAVDNLDFPFETVCEVSVDDDDHVLIDVDLPEIEDVIPETQLQALKSGIVKEKRRKVADRNVIYAELVCGIALAVASTAMSTAPTLSFVTVAGRTQRKRRASMEIEDEYVIEVKVPRHSMVAVNAAALDPVALVQTLPSRLHVLANGALKKIEAPRWR